MIVNATIRLGLVLAVACGGTQPVPDVGNISAPAMGCPPAQNVRLASFSGGTARDGVSADRHGWFLPLGAQMIDEPADPLNPLAAERPMTTAEAATFMPSKKLRPWLMMPGHAPCEVTYGARYVELVSDGQRNHSFRVELKGCPVPADGKADAAVVVFAERAPADCQIARSHPVAQFRDYKGGSTPDPVPPELVKFLGTATAKQVLLWRIQAIDVREKAAFWSIDTSTITIGKSADECSWETTNLGMMYERSGGAIVPFAYSHGSRSMEIYQYVFGALVDNERISSVVVTNLGEYQVYDLTKSPHVVGQHLRWFIPNEEDYAGDGVLGPYCGP